MTWWGQTLGSGSAGSFQPKQKNRFVVQMGRGGTLLSVTTVSKPVVTVEAKEYRMINHFYKYPGIPKWEPITMKFVDGNIWGSDAKANIQTSKVLWTMLLESGYVTQDGTGNRKIGSPSKASMIGRSFGNSLTIKQLKPDGTAIETWTIFNPILTKISWGELDYGDDGLVEYTLDVAYDWAELS